MEKFTYDDDVFVLDSKYKDNNSISILCRKFDSYVNQNKTEAVIYGKSKIKMYTWALFKTHNDAIQGAIAFLIETKEFGKIVNENTDINKLYIEFEKQHPELILKYMDCVVSE